MSKKCDVCNKPFKNAHGVSTHKTRTPACGGTAMSWGAGAKKPAKEGSGKAAIREILADHPQGLGTAEIRTEMEERGFNMNANYISQAAAGDPGLVRVERGRYRLKSKVGRAPQRSGTSVVQEAVAEAKSGITNMPREALLLRIETLETQSRALHDAHLSLMRGLFV